MKYYLAGPMSGLPDFNYPQFGLACLLLRQHGLEICSPHEDNDEPWTEDYSVYFRAGLKKLLDCDAIIMLQGWERSEGAMLEFKLAAKLDMPAYAFDTKTCMLEEMSCSAEGTFPLILTQNPGP